MRAHIEATREYEDEFFEKTIPGLVLLKARKRTKPMHADFISTANEIIAKNTFPVFCSCFNAAFDELIADEIDRDDRQGVVTRVSRNTEKDYVVSMYLFMLREGKELASDIFRPWDVLEGWQEKQEINMAERQAGYMLARFAPQKLARALQERFTADDTTPVLQAEAAQRCLTSLARLLKMMPINPAP